MAAHRAITWVAGLGCALTLLLGRTAQAELQHTVREGQSLVSIARGYKVSVSSLAAANERKESAPLRVGEVLSVPQKGVVVLGAGQSLWSVARQHGCSVDALARANGLTSSAPVRPGMRLTLPGAKGAERTSTRSTARLQSQPAVPAGTVQLYRVATSERLKLTITDAKGRVRPQAAARLARFLRPRRSTKQKRPEPRLLALLAEVSHHYRGRTIQVISGYREAGGYTSRESRHTKGAAIDLRVQGIDSRALSSYLRHFRDVGVGYYPNANFVHLDVRDKNAYWVDLSSSGRRPSYLDREQRDYFEGKSKREEGLAELGRSVEATLDQLAHGEPDVNDPKAADE